jgi:hypothetical protein
MWLNRSSVIPNGGKKALATIVSRIVYFNLSITSITRDINSQDGITITRVR